MVPMDTASQKQRCDRSKLSLRHKRSPRITASVSQPVSSERVPPSVPSQLPTEAVLSPPRHLTGLPACSVVLRRCTPSKSPLKEGRYARLEGCKWLDSPSHTAGDVEAIPSPLHGKGSQTKEHLPALSKASDAVRVSHHGGRREDLCRVNEEEAGDSSETFPPVVLKAGPDSFVCQICLADLSVVSLAEKDEHVNACCDKAEKESRDDIQQVASHRCLLCEKTLPSRQVWVTSAA